MGRQNSSHFISTLKTRVYETTVVQNQWTSLPLWALPSGNAEKNANLTCRDSLQQTVCPLNEPFPFIWKKWVCQTVVQGEGEGMQKHQCSYRWPFQEQAGQEGRLEERLFNNLSGAQHCWAQWLKWSRKLKKCRKQKTVWKNSITT